MLPLTAERLLTLDHIPVRGELSLQTITEFYITYLARRQFHFEIANKLKEIRLRFEPNHLPHLLGVHHFEGVSSGHKGLLDLKNGAVTFENLLAVNKGAFEDDELRMLCLPFIYQMIHTPHLHLARPNDMTQASFYFRSPLSNKLCEFRIRKMHKDDPSSTFYIPLSFRVGKSNPFTKVTVRKMSELAYDDGYHFPPAHTYSNTQASKQRKK
ncbi:PBECR4 domain-containing protein [Paenibacillus sp. SGZ-1009]|uniref:PBECR4 domain-containing protein n=1 Tax=Paenibacillus campi TaxID=3106031 RepID=UPI002AFEACB1|nr:PBECR4 domain-containing protein [Paenibacillus sp. SGZ-1009]